MWVVSDHDVVWFEISMYDVFVVHFEEGAQQLSHDEFLLFDHYFLGQFLFEGEGELLHF